MNFVWFMAEKLFTVFYCKARVIRPHTQGCFSIVERLCSDLDRKEPRYKSPTLLYLYRQRCMRLQACVKEKGGYFEHSLWHFSS